METLGLGALGGAMSGCLRQLGLLKVGMRDIVAFTHESLSPGLLRVWAFP
jgi:hypothetical protein